MPTIHDAANLFRDQGVVELRMELARERGLRRKLEDHLRSNAYLAAVVCTAHSERAAGYGGVDAFDHRIGEFGHLTREEKLAIIPALRQIGFSVLVYEDSDSCPMTVRWAHCPRESVGDGWLLPIGEIGERFRKVAG